VKRNTSYEGESRKRAAHALLAARREIYVRRGKRALLLRLLDTPEATIDDVRAVVELPPEINPKLFGPVVAHLADAGIIRGIGSTKSKRPEAHARKIDVWALTDRAAALSWLAANPDQPDQGPDAAGSFVINPINPHNGTGPAVATQPSLY
jgi:hypothetical protein